MVKETEKEEEFRLEVTGKIYIQPLVVLKTLITELEIHAEEVSQLTKVKTIKLITQLLKEKLKDEDKGTTTLLQINDLIGSKTPTEILVAEGKEETGKDKEEDVDDPEISFKMKNNDEITPLLKDKCSLWIKDFKISGQIGDSKSCISFTSLIRQIEAGTEKGYDDKEIIQVVIRSITAGSSIRNYLESRSNLTLSTVRGILRAHYREKTATELYTELCNLSQSQKENPQEFLLRALDIRQRVMFASNETEDKHQYHPDLVQAMFLHSLMTGIQSDNIRQEMRPVLSDKNVRDETLISSLNQMVLRENERLAKSKGSRGKVIKKEATEESDVFGEFKNEVKRELAEIRQLVKNAYKPPPQQQQQHTENKTTRKRKPGCPQCQQSGNGDNVGIVGFVEVPNISKPDAKIGLEPKTNKIDRIRLYGKCL